MRDAAGEGGYARALTDEERQAQQAELAGHIARHDVVITTAQVPGRKPPLLVTEDALKEMAAGAVVVDMGSGPLGGNVAGSVPGETIVTGNGVTVIGAGNLAASVPAASSAFLARNITTLLLYLVKDGALAIDPGDEIQAGVVITHEGAVIHPATAALLAESHAWCWLARRCYPVTTELLTDITIFVLALLVGFEVISKVPATLHTPLMSAANSIHGIVLAGAMLIAVTAHDAARATSWPSWPSAFAAMNVVGGYAVTGRMLKMFRRTRTPVPAADPRPRSAATARLRPGRHGPARPPVMSAFDWITQLLYVGAATCFVLGLHLMNSPASARRGNQVSTARHGPRHRHHPGPGHPRGHGQPHRLDRDHRRRAAGRRGRASTRPARSR